MLQIALTTAACYALPRSIEYITARPNTLESRVDHLRAKLFSYKVACRQFANTNRLTRSISNAISLYSSHMWLAVLVVPGIVRLLPITGFLRKPLYILVGYAIYYGKEISEEKLIEFINSTQILRLMTNPVAFRLISSKIGLRLLNQYTERVRQNEELLGVLNLRLGYATTKRLLTAQSSEGSSILDNAHSFRGTNELVSR
jgi:hypothetical protein